MSEQLHQYAPMSPAPIEAPAVETERGINRRGFLRLGAIGIAGLYLGKKGLDVWAGIEETRLEAAEAPSGLYVLSYGDPALSPEAIVAMPGMGEHLGKPLAAQIKADCTLNPASPLAYYNVGPDITLPKMADDLEAFKEETRIKYMSLYLNSLSGVLAMAAVIERGIPLRRVFMNSSPFGIDTVDFGPLAHLAANLPSTGMEGKLLATEVKEIQKEQAVSKGVLQRGYYQATHGASMKMEMAELRLLDHIHLAKLMASPAAGSVITPQTEFYYMYPLGRKRNDGVVRDMQAIRDWQRAVAPHGASFAAVGIRSRRHADNNAAIKAMQPAMGRTQQSYAGSAFVVA